MDFPNDKVAKKALKLNGTELSGRSIKLDKPQGQSPAGRGRGGGTPRGGGTGILCYYL